MEEIIELIIKEISTVIIKEIIAGTANHKLFKKIFLFDWRNDFILSIEQLRNIKIEQMMKKSKYFYIEKARHFFTPQMSKNICVFSSTDVYGWIFKTNRTLPLWIFRSSELIFRSSFDQVSLFFDQVLIKWAFNPIVYQDTVKSFNQDTRQSSSR